MPVFAGRYIKSRVNASRPPADAPTATIGNTFFGAGAVRGSSPSAGWALSCAPVVLETPRDSEGARARGGARFLDGLPALCSIAYPPVERACRGRTIGEMGGEHILFPSSC